MWINDAIIDATLLRLFHERRVGARTVTPMALRHAWRQTGLRATDLDAALQRLESQGCLRSESTLRGDMFVLLPEGEERLHGLSATVGEMGRWVNHALSQRPPSKAPLCRDTRRRRRADHETIGLQAL
jgi:hypothetical protein